MTFDEALEYLYSRLKFGSVPGLERIRALCALLGNPQDKLRYIHVAGTNGKGSICSMISNMLISAGYKTGLFISPYVTHFTERIQINSRMISESEFADLMAEIKPLVEQLDSQGITPTEFEVLTAAAFLYYYKNGCDIVVLEVGLGGLCDSTNLIKSPDVCVITSVSYDHTNILGDSIEEIAEHKCGIIKQGSAVVSYPQMFDQVSGIIAETAKKHSCPLYCCDKNEIKNASVGEFGCEFTYKGFDLKTSLIGEHQIYNAATAFEAAQAMRSKGIRLSDTDIYSGILKAGMPARLQVVSRNPLIVIDGAHNPDGIAALVKSLNTVFKAYETVAVMGMMKDKDVEKSVSLIAPYFKRAAAVTVDNPRSMKSYELSGIIKKFCSDVSEYSDSMQAFSQMKDSLKEGEMLLVCGSLYLASEIEEYL